jgi:hypothetical protein
VLSTEQDVVGRSSSPGVGDQSSAKRQFLIGNLVTPLLTHFTEAMTSSLRRSGHITGHPGDVAGQTSRPGGSTAGDVGRARGSENISWEFVGKGDGPFG